MIMLFSKLSQRDNTRKGKQQFCSLTYIPHYFFETQYNMLPSFFDKNLYVQFRFNGLRQPSVIISIRVPEKSSLYLNNFSFCIDQICSLIIPCMAIHSSQSILFVFQCPQHTFMSHSHIPCILILICDSLIFDQYLLCAHKVGNGQYNLVGLLLGTQLNTMIIPFP